MSQNSIEIEFRTKNDKQIEAAEAWLDPNAEQILYGGAKAGGKSYLGCTLIFGDALLYPGTHYFIARKELNDLRKHTIPSVHEVFRNWGLDISKYAPYNGQDNVFNLHNGSRVYLIACKSEPSDPLFERFGSMQMTRGWIEEAGEIEEDAKSNLWLSIGRWMNEKYGLKKKLLITANPKKNWMKRDFIDPWKQDVLAKSYRFIQAFATDNPYNSDDYLETLRSEKNQVRRERLWKGNWDYEDDKDSLVESDALSDAFSNTIEKDGETYMTVDVARFGRDSTVFTFWDGLELNRIERYQKQDTDKTKQMIKDFAVTERIPYSHILIDEDGVGGGVVDGLKGTRGFVANSSPIPTAAEIRMRKAKVTNEFVPKTNFKNLKSQVGFKMAELINEHKIHFDVIQYRDMILEELSALLRDRNPDSDAKLELVPKDEVKAQLGRSPDIGDALLYRAWFEIKQAAVEEDPDRGEVVIMQHSRMEMKKKKSHLNSSE